MSFSQLSEYSEGALPHCGTATAYTICDGVSAYNPIDVSGLKAAIDSAMDNALNNAESSSKKIEKGVQDLAVEWGVKFISIDRKDLNIVDPVNYQKGIDTVTTSLKEQQERCNEIVTSIVNKTEDVKDYLKTIEENNKRYEETKSKLEEQKNQLNNLVNSYNNERSKEEPNASTLASLGNSITLVKQRIDELQLEVTKFEGARIDSPDGSWVLG